MIKFLDIYKQDKNLHPLMIKDIRNIFKKGDFILGEHVKKFENKFSNFCGSKFSLGCANGTDALTIALKALNLKKEFRSYYTINDLLFDSFLYHKC